MNLTTKIQDVLQEEKNPALRIDALMGCVAIEMAYNCKTNPDDEEVLNVLREAYLQKIKTIEQIADKAKNDDVHD